MNEIVLKNGELITPADNFNEDVCLRALKVVQKILNYDEQLLLITQTNFKRESFDTPYITFWHGNSNVLANQSYFDSENGIEYFYDLTKTYIDVNFYGTEARKNANAIFGLIARSQESKEEQIKQKIKIFQPKEILTFDLKTRAGLKYERYLIYLDIQYINITSVKRNAIEDIELKLIGEK